MIDKIELTPASLTGEIKKTGSADSYQSFGELLKNYIKEVDAQQKIADETINKFIAGEVPDVHQVMIALEKAELSLQLTIQIKNKLVEAYQEIMRMQV
ncbi:MAG: flagellar hook-basal body complex protein FliE [Candidatus Desulfofervidaceae bacterium]|nr:flagellar hook-basal body complex protein FliE [Candidatus Desulfofervidaceae bacterium]MDL1969674.1 flagellar hook-basal body complex protein FliE [Candidatus Desulfofervidaceae bacterium]